MRHILDIYILGCVFTLGFILGEGNVNWKKYIFHIPLLLIAVAIWPVGWFYEGLMWAIRGRANA